jgi:hypothetical protein
MARTTHLKVKDILGDHYDGSSSLEPFIDTASSLVDKVVTADTESLLSSGDLEIIERWLSAHFYGHMDQFMSNKSTGGASGGFMGQTAMALNSTQYGQTAMTLDCTGELAKLSQQAMTGKKRMTMTWLGTRYKNDESERVADQ